MLRLGRELVSSHRLLIQTHPCIWYRSAPICDASFWGRGDRIGTLKNMHTRVALKTVKFCQRVFCRRGSLSYTCVELGLNGIEEVTCLHARMADKPKVR